MQSNLAISNSVTAIILNPRHFEVKLIPLRLTVTWRQLGYFKIPLFGTYLMSCETSKWWGSTVANKLIWFTYHILTTWFTLLSTWELLPTTRKNSQTTLVQSHTDHVIDFTDHMGTLTNHSKKFTDLVNPTTYQPRDWLYWPYGNSYQPPEKNQQPHINQELATHQPHTTAV